MDRNGSRLWMGASRALDEGLTNAFFLRSRVEYLEEHIPAGRVGAIWLPFPDPLPKTRQARHRLPSPPFLERYRRLLCRGGAVHLKTDDMALVDFAERAVRVAGGRVLGGFQRRTVDGDMLAAVHTTYEQRYRREGRTIYERTFCLD